MCSAYADDHRLHLVTMVRGPTSTESYLRTETSVTSSGIQAVTALSGHSSFFPIKIGSFSLYCETYLKTLSVTPCFPSDKALDGMNVLVGISNCYQNNYGCGPASEEQINVDFVFFSAENCNNQADQFCFAIAAVHTRTFAQFARSNKGPKDSRNLLQPTTGTI